MERWAEYRYFPSQNLTLTRVVFEWILQKRNKFCWTNLTLTRVVFEFNSKYDNLITYDKFNFNKSCI